MHSHIERRLRNRKACAGAASNDAVHMPVQSPTVRDLVAEQRGAKIVANGGRDRLNGFIRPLWEWASLTPANLAHIVGELDQHKGRCLTLLPRTARCETKCARNR